MKLKSLLTILAILSVWPAHGSKTDLEVAGVRDALKEAIKNSQPWIPPIEKPTAVISGIESYIVLQKNINLGRYYLVSLSYDFQNAAWEGDYVCRPSNGVFGIDCGFRVYASNEKEVEYRFELYP